MAQAGLRAFRKIQLFHEADHGTPDAATEVILGSLADYMNDPTIQYPDEDRGSLSRHQANDYISQEFVPLSFETPEGFNFRQLAYWFSNSIIGNVTATQPDSANEPNAYLWTFTFDGTERLTPEATNGIETFTLEYGESDIQAYEAEYVFAMRVEVAGEGDGPCTISLDLGARQVTDTTFTAALSAPTVQRAPFNLAQFYVDTAWADLGTTEKADLLLGFSWVFETQFEAYHTADNQLYFQAVSEDKKFAEFTPTYRWTDDADAERTKFEGRTSTYLRLKLNGATELDSGQSNPPYCQFDMAARCTAWPTPDVGNNGELTVSPTYQTVYDATGAKEFEVTVLNDMAVLSS